jgi:hypothetical protein
MPVYQKYSLRSRLGKDFEKPFGTNHRARGLLSTKNGLRGLIGAFKRYTNYNAFSETSLIPTYSKLLDAVVNVSPTIHSAFPMKV